jgi:hypothetical protein
MALKTGFFSLALGALLLGSTAQAADAQAEHDASSVVAQDFRGPGWGNGSNGGHDNRRTPPPNQNGRYELRMVKKWVEGRYEQVWVPEDCRGGSRRYVRKCEGGHYAQKWVPGRYEQLEQWVWVPAPRHGGYRRT